MCKCKSEDALEALAAKQHAIWAHWMKYLFTVCPVDAKGVCTIPAELTERWQRQACTEYEDLSEKEKLSDRQIVKDFLW